MAIRGVEIHCDPPLSAPLKFIIDPSSRRSGTCEPSSAAKGDSGERESEEEQSKKPRTTRKSEERRRPAGEILLTRTAGNRMRSIGIQEHKLVWALASKSEHFFFRCSLHSSSEAPQSRAADGGGPAPAQPSARPAAIRPSAASTAGGGGEGGLPNAALWARPAGGVQA